MDNEFDIAIVGMAGRFPGAKDLDDFWRNLAAGVESIVRLSDEEMIAAGVPPAVLTRPDFVKAAPVLDDPGLFDAGFFGFAPGEAAAMDPQHRLLLELAHAALEDAGCDPDRQVGRIGVFVGSAMNTYFMSSGLNDRLAEDYIPTLIVNDKDFLGTRISYKLGLRGPSLTVQTACSTSLVAVHLARQSLLSEETDLAVAGAVSVRVPHRTGYFYDGGGVVSPDGHVRAFDAEANGTVFGSGAGVVVLKRLADALAQGDRIHAVIKGSAVNNDGAAKAGYTAPSVNGQADVIVEALANAEVDAGDITYVEAHGSGTPVGDPIEILALTKAYRNFTQRNGYCAIGSVKSNVGHLDAAAGMAGLIKTVLALKHRRIPPTLHYTRPNPEIDFPATPFFVNTATVDWPATGGPRLAGVMSTGMGGTNAHVILKEAPAAAPEKPPSGPHLLPLSARTPAALETMAQNLAAFLGSPPAPNLADVAWTLQTGRRLFPCRRFVVCDGAEDASTALKATEATRTNSGIAREETRPPVVFLLPGVGDHYVGMGQGLYERFAVFREEVDRCAQILLPLLGTDIRDLMYPRDGVSRVPGKAPGIDLKRMLGRAPEEPADPAARKLDQTINCQPALFTVEYALARLWMHWGVQPDRLVGHSMGEYVAACLAGVFSLEDALRLIAARAKLVNELPLGSMLAVLLSEEELLPLLADQLSISLINGPKLCVVAGPVAAMADFQGRLKAREIVFRPVRNAHAFHSRMLDPIVDSFVREVRPVRLQAPKIPFISNATGTWITAEQAVDPLYWVEHARRTARFSDALEQMWKLPDCLPLEVGPGRTLGVLAMQHPARPASANPASISTLRHDYENQPDAAFLLKNAGRLWLAGIGLDWERLDGRAVRRKVSLPTYPFERKLHWMTQRHEPAPVVIVEAPTAQKPDRADWFYVPSWSRSPFPGDEPRENGVAPLWLIIGDRSELAGKVKALVEKRGAIAVLASFGPAFASQGSAAYEIRPAALEDYVSLLGALKPDISQALNIIHLGPLSSRVKSPDAGYDESDQELGFFSLVNLAKAVGDVGLSAPIGLGVVTRQVHEVTGEETLNPSMATILGPCGVLPKEYPNITSFSVDLTDVPAGGRALDELARHLVDEFRNPVRGGVVAYRARFRWERTYQPRRLAAVAPTPAEECLRALGLRPRGVYLITGGTGGIGLALAKYLAETCQARLVLTKKTPFPEKSAWRARLAAGDLSESDKQVVTALLEIETLGGEVEVKTCEASDRAGTQRVLAETLAKHSAIHGVVHAAGIVRAGLIQAKTNESIAEVLAPKVTGTCLLHELLPKEGVDFLVLFSSITSVITPFAEADYSAANSFLDAFAPYANAAGKVRTLTINWPGWKEAGQLVKLKSLAGVESWKQDALSKAILTKDGLDAFQRALAARLPQVIVSPEDLLVLVAESRQPLDLSKYVAGGVALAGANAGARRKTDAAAQPASELENVIAGTWQRVLGIPDIGVDENFFDLGGHSLLLVRVHTELQKTLRRSLSITALFQFPTIAALARHLGAAGTDAPVSNPAQERAGRFKQALARQRPVGRP